MARPQKGVVPAKAVKQYHMFNGRMPKKVKAAKFHVPEYLVYLGEAHAIEYRSNKKHGGGDGKPAVYVHRIETKVSLYMDERCGKVLYMMGDKLKVTDAGIEN